MKRILIAALLLAWVSVGNANEEITVELAGGATMEFVWIEPGTFTMGSPESEEGREENEGPQHEVTISQGFYLAKYEVTQGQWEGVMGNNPSYHKGKNFSTDTNRPVEKVSWHDVQSLIHALNEAAGDSLYRLPSEAEWEYACRAGTTTRWSFGDDESQLGDYAWHSRNNSPPGTKEVGTKLPNPWGLYDMHGNVWEWCEDWDDGYSSGTQVDPTGPSTGSLRVGRGGSFYPFSLISTRSANRESVSPDTRGDGIGARLLRMEPKLTNVSPESWGQIKESR